MRETGDQRASAWRRLGTFVALVAVAFAVTLALVVGNRLSGEALGVLAGAVCGVGAAIPTSLIVVAVTRRRGGSSDGALGRMSMSHQASERYPPVIVVSPQGVQERAHPGWNGLPPSLSAPMERNFTVVGGRSLDTEGMRYGDERCS